MYVCLSVLLFVCVSMHICMSVCLSLYMHVCLPGWLPSCLPLCRLYMYACRAYISVHACIRFSLHTIAYICRICRNVQVICLYTCIPAHVSKMIEVPLTVSYCHGNENSS